MKSLTRGLSVALSLLLSLPLAAQQSRAGELQSTHQATSRTAEARVHAVLDGMIKSHETYLSVPVEDGKALRLLTEATAARSVVEVGTSTGYSGLWLCLALEKTGGHLTTFEIDHQRALRAQKHFQEAGVDKLVTIIEGDAHEQVTKLKEAIDVAFIDADKSGYVDYLNKLLPLVRPGGLILAHNVDMVPDYVQLVSSRADLETIFYMAGGGLSVTLKKRSEN